MTETVGRPGSERRIRRPGAFGRALKVTAIVFVLVVAGVGVGEYLSSEIGEPTLVVYTYSSLFGGPGTPAFDYVVHTFASAHHVRVDVEYPTGTLFSTLKNQENAPAADLVVGLDEITAPQAEANGLLLPYSPPALADISPGLVHELSPQHGVTPYEWGYLAIDYNTTFATATGGAVAHLTLPELAQNSSWAKELLIEDPIVDITGQEFLVNTVEYYEHVLHQNWTGFWTSLLPNLQQYRPSPSWGDAFGQFTTPPNSPAMVVSYSTDPAYAAYYGQSGQFNSTVTWWNGTAYGWKTIYGVGIVSGTRHLALAQEFVDWLLSGSVQSEIPLNEWEYPANETIPLPPAYAAAVDPSSVVALNAATTPSAVASALPGWVSTYQELANRLLPP